MNKQHASVFYKLSRCMLFEGLTNVMDGCCRTTLIFQESFNIFNNVYYSLYKMKISILILFINFIII